MAVERTLSIIKPDAVKKRVIGKVNTIIENAGLTIVAQKMVHLSRREASLFYFIHRERPFYQELVEFMVSGPVVVQVLQGTNAIAKNREVMGATNPKDAAEGTIRKLYAASIGENAVHGSDSAETAKEEIAFFFAEREVFPS